MIAWISRMFGRQHPEGRPPAVSADDRNALAKERSRVPGRLNAADEAVRKAMKHADDVFVYHGPDRRGSPR